MQPAADPLKKAASSFAGACMTQITDVQGNGRTWPQAPCPRRCGEPLLLRQIWISSALIAVQSTPAESKMASACSAIAPLTPRPLPAPSPPPPPPPVPAADARCLLLRCDAGQTGRGAAVSLCCICNCRWRLEPQEKAARAHAARQKQTSSFAANTLCCRASACA